MADIRVLYASTEGNTASFIDKLATVATTYHDSFEAQMIGDETPDAIETQPFVALVPTYLTGGTGTGSEVQEEFTNALGDYIAVGSNQTQLKGVIGSGNRNFNVQFALTAKRYAERFEAPLLATYELRGSRFDAEKIYPLIRDAIIER